MLVVTQADIAALLAPKDLIAIIRSAAEAAAKGEVQAPDRIYVSCGGTILGAMPAATEHFFATKLATLTPANAGRGKPALNGVVALGEGETGETLALLDAGALTAQRTGAIGALALDLLADSALEELGIVGTGTQALWQAVFATSVRPLGRIHCLARSDSAFERYRAELAKLAPQLEIRRAADAQALLTSTSAIIAATSSASPVLPDDPARLAGKTLISIGSFRLNQQELPNAAYALAETVLVDNPQAATAVGDLVNALSAGLLTPEQIVPIGTQGANLGATRVFKSVGWAVYDLFAACFFYEQAKARGRGQAVTL